MREFLIIMIIYTLFCLCNTEKKLALDWALTSFLRKILIKLQYIHVKLQYILIKLQYILIKLQYIHVKLHYNTFTPF